MSLSMNKYLYIYIARSEGAAPRLRDVRSGDGAGARKRTLERDYHVILHYRIIRIIACVYIYI